MSTEGEELESYIRQKFNVKTKTFLNAIKLSPNAQGYLSGAISELVLKEKIEGLGYEVLRIKEKWEGPKNPKHRGDFYIKKKNTENWFVLESKGVKSNSEKWHKLYNYDNLKKFLLKHADKLPWLEQNQR